MGCVFTSQKPSKLLTCSIFFACKMSQRFAADQTLQLLQSIALESSDGEYSDSKSDELNNVIADIKNEEDSFDSDNKFTD